MVSAVTSGGLLSKWPLLQKPVEFIFTGFFIFVHFNEKKILDKLVGAPPTSLRREISIVT